MLAVIRLEKWCGLCRSIRGRWDYQAQARRSPPSRKTRNFSPHSLWPAREATRVRGDARLEAWHAHLLEALGPLTSDRGRGRLLCGVLARAFHRDVPVDRDVLLLGLARGAALALEPLDQERGVAADVGATLHEATRFALVGPRVQARLGVLLPDELGLDVRRDQSNGAEIGRADA